MVLCFMRISLVIVKLILGCLIRLGVVFPFHQSIALGADGATELATGISVKGMIANTGLGVL